MVRKLFIVLVTLGMLSPMAAFALGFENITLHSALGQKLDADIGIISPSPRDISNLKVRMAPYQAFSRAGIDKPPVLMSLKFAIKQRAGGQYYIHVSSPQPIREPYLDFLLQLTWPTGRMLREYTMLLDPPSLFRKERHAIVQTPVVQPPVATARPAPTPMPRPAPAPAVAPVKPVPPVPPAVAKPPTVTQPPVSPLERVARSDEHRGLFPYIPIGGGGPAMAPAATGTVMVTHITRKGDKLWDIAQKMRPDEAVSIYQMMMALLKSNPQAFEQDNVNRLKAGYVLRIENPALLNAMSKREAAHEFRIQTQDWEAYRQRVARAAGKQPLVTTHKMTAAPAPGKSAAESGKLELLVPEGKGESVGNGQASTTSVDKIKSIEAARKQLSLAIEAAVTEKRKNAEVTGRLKQLESQIANMQRLIALKNDELATLQEQMRKQGEPTPHVVTPSTTAVTTSVTPLVEPAGKTSVVAPTESVAVPTKATAVPMTAQNTSAVSSSAGEAGAAQTETPQVAPSSTAVAPPRPASIAPAKSWWQFALATASGFLTILLASPLLLAAAAAILLILILLLIVVRRRKKGDGFQESILTGEANVAEQGSATEGKNGDESSFLSDFAVSGVNAIQEDNEVDPLTEADVYVAYGRYQQAEELLGEALKQDPKRKDLKLKLLEVHYANKNRAGFEAVAEDLYAEIGDPDAPEWKKVVDMGTELAPGNPMFSGSASPSVTGAAVVGTSPTTLSKDEVMDIGLNTGMFQNEDFQNKTGAQAPTGDSGEDLGFDLDLDDAAVQAGPGADLDFNLDLEETPIPAAVEAKKPEAEKPDEGADFNLDFTEPQVEQAAAVTPTRAEKGTDDEFSLEFHSEEEPVSMVEPEESGLDFDLGGLDLDGPATAPGPASASREDDTRIDMETPSALREDDTEVELSAGAGAKAPEAMDFDIEAGDAASLDIPDDLDEVGTKLDLARAYIEMGDPDGARSILDEVVDEGSDSQKQEAQALISQIG